MIEVGVSPSNPLGQRPLPGLGYHMCTFQCLTCCPFPRGYCVYYDDAPLYVDDLEYPKFFWWRLDHLTDEQAGQLTELDSDMMIVTPDCLGRFYVEPVGSVYRCPRCLSTDVGVGGDWVNIKCNMCGYGETLVDFPDNIGREWFGD